MPLQRTRRELGNAVESKYSSVAHNFKVTGEREKIRERERERERNGDHPGAEIINIKKLKRIFSNEEVSEEC